MNSAYITLTSALAKEELIKKLHRTPPFNLIVTPIASCPQEDGPATFEREEALGDENNNADEIGEDEFVFGSSSVLDVSCDQVPPCSGCGGLAGFVCSGCPGLAPTYCSRSCQAKEWPKHQEHCRPLTRGSGGETTQKILLKKRSGQSKTNEKSYEDCVKEKSEAIPKNKELVVEKCKDLAKGKSQESETRKLAKEKEESNTLNQESDETPDHLEQTSHSIQSHQSGALSKIVLEVGGKGHDERVGSSRDSTFTRVELAGGVAKPQQGSSAKTCEPPIQVTLKEAEDEVSKQEEVISDDVGGADHHDHDPTLDAMCLPKELRSRSDRSLVDQLKLFSGRGKVHQYTQGEWKHVGSGEYSVGKNSSGFLLKMQENDVVHSLFDSRDSKLVSTRAKSRKFYWAQEEKKGGGEREQWAVVLGSAQEVLCLAELVEKLTNNMEDSLILMDSTGVENVAGNSRCNQRELLKSESLPSGCTRQFKESDLLLRESEDLAHPRLKPFDLSGAVEDKGVEEVCTLNPGELNDPSRFSTYMPGIGGKMKARLLHIDHASGNFFVCGEQHWEELVQFQERLQGEISSSFVEQPVDEERLLNIQPLQLVVFCSSQDSMWYRGIVKVVQSDEVKLFCPDYGFCEEVDIGRVRPSIRQSAAQMPFFARPCKSIKPLRYSIEVGLQIDLEVTNRDGVFTEACVL